MPLITKLSHWLRRDAAPAQKTRAELDAERIARSAALSEFDAHVEAVERILEQARWPR